MTTRKVCDVPSGGRPVPMEPNPWSTRGHKPRPRPTGLDWAAHRAPDAAPEGALVTGPRTKREAAQGAVVVVSAPACWVCGTIAPLDKSNMCQGCIDASDRLQELKVERQHDARHRQGAFEVQVIEKQPKTEQQILTELDVTTADVRAWAVEAGLLADGKRGRLPRSLVVAYANARGAVL